MRALELWFLVQYLQDRLHLSRLMVYNNNALCFSSYATLFSYSISSLGCRSHQKSRICRKPPSLFGDRAISPLYTTVKHPVSPRKAPSSHMPPGSRWSKENSKLVPMPSIKLPVDYSDSKIPTSEDFFYSNPEYLLAAYASWFYHVSRFKTGNGFRGIRLSRSS